MAARGGLERHAREPADHEVVRGLEREPDVLAARVGGADERAVARDQRAELPVQPRRQPAHEQDPRDRRLGVVADRDGADRPQVGPQVRRVERRRHALAPRRRAQPREVDDVRVAQERHRPVDAVAHVGLVDGVEQHDLGEREQRLDRLRVPVRRPDARSAGRSRRAGRRSCRGARGAARRRRRSPSRAAARTRPAAGARRRRSSRPRRSCAAAARPRSTIVRAACERPTWRRRLAISPLHCLSTTQTRLSVRAGT